MKNKLTSEERNEIIKLKEFSAQRAKEVYAEKGIKKMHEMKTLAEAFMRYIDLLGVNVYTSKHFNSHKVKPIYRDKLFPPGEIGTITKYLKKEHLIIKDDWGRYVVKWR